MHSDKEPATAVRQSDSATRGRREKILNRVVRTARMSGVGIALSSLLSSGAYAADPLTQVTPAPHVDADDFWTRPYLFGDLGRTQLKEQGIALSLDLIDEAVGNA